MRRARAVGLPCHLLLEEHVLPLLLVALWVRFLLPRDPVSAVSDPDIWWHLRNCFAAWNARAFLERDIYSFTALGAPWINHEWLAEIPYAVGWHVAGARGVAIVTLLCLEAIFAGLYWLTFRKTQSSTTALLVTLTASLLATVSFGPRTILFGWLLLVLELLVLEDFTRAEGLARADNLARAQKSILALPLLFAVWINLHGSWLIGLALFIVFILSGCGSLRTGDLQMQPWTRSQLRLLGSTLVLSIGALFINPYGWRLLAYPLDLAFRQRLNVANVLEWQPLNFQSMRALIFIFCLAAALLAAILRRAGPCWTLCELAFAAFGAYSALRHTRFLFLAGILSLPILGRHIFLSRADADASRRPRHRAALNACLVVLMVLAFQGAALRQSRSSVRTEEAYPAHALPFLQAFHPRGRVFNECLWGGYLAFHAPQIPVFIDSRLDIFERNGTLRDYLDIIRLKDSLRLLDQYRIRYVLFEPDTPLVYLLQQTQAWKTDYSDGSVVLLERIHPLSPPADVLTR